MQKRASSLLRWTGIFLLVLILLAGIRYAWSAFPIITGYSAKMACSCSFLSGRTLASVEEEELGSGPLKLASLQKDMTDSSVTATVFGMAERKAIYRKGLGCTLINKLTEAVIRKQPVGYIYSDTLAVDTIPWPLGDRLPDTFPAGFPKKQLDTAVAAAFRDAEPGKPLRTRAVLVVYNGQLVAEKYADGFDRTTSMLSWSMAKSVTSAMIGILVKDGKLQPEAPAPVPEWRSVKDGREKITLKNLLQHTSGLDFEENYSKATDATNMLYQEADMGGYTAAHGLREPPGTRFYYSSGNSNILSGIIRREVGEKEYFKFPAQRLFRPASIRSMVLEPDANGTFVGSSYAFANARDWARFGMLYANDGVWDGKRILPEGWVKQTTAAVAVAPQGEYGYQWWLNAGIAGNPLSRKYPALPADMYYADGYEGQFVVVIPSRHLVLVRLGQTAGNWFDFNAFVKNILDALPPA